MTTKNASSIKSENLQNDKQGSGRAILGRLYWMMLGHIILISAAISIYNSRSFGWRDIFYLLVLFSIVYIRYIDIKNWGGKTATGETAKITDWRTFSRVLVVIGLVVLVLAHLPDILRKV